MLKLVENDAIARFARQCVTLRLQIFDNYTEETRVCFEAWGRSRLGSASYDYGECRVCDCERMMLFNRACDLTLTRQTADCGRARPFYYARARSGWARDLPRSRMEGGVPGTLSAKPNRNRRRWLGLRLG